jgi:hypothetical protein
MGWANVNNQVCLAHLIRDVQYAIDVGDDIFAPELRHLLGACRIGRRRERLANATMKTYAARLNAGLDELIRLTPTHEAGVKLKRMIMRTRQYLFVFVTNRDIPSTNNGSERALRLCAVFRKITNGLRTEWGAKLYADIRSVIETARRCQRAGLADRARRRNRRDALAVSVQQADDQRRSGHRRRRGLRQRNHRRLPRARRQQREGHLQAQSRRSDRGNPTITVFALKP